MSNLVSIINSPAKTDYLATDFNMQNNQNTDLGKSI